VFSYVFKGLDLCSQLAPRRFLSASIFIMYVVLTWQHVFLMFVGMSPENSNMFTICSPFDIFSSLLVFSCFPNVVSCVFRICSLLGLCVPEHVLIIPIMISCVHNISFYCSTFVYVYSSCVARAFSYAFIKYVEVFKCVVMLSKALHIGS
jgi:hypothetical protein